MKELEIECKGIADISGYGQDIFLKHYSELTEVQNEEMER